jgi:hypothetical protein
VAKKTKNQSAVKHGVYSRELMLPGEKISDYKALREAHYDEWVPEGVTEEYLVDDLCALRWRRRRLVQYHQISLQRRNAQVREENEARFHSGELQALGEEFSETASVEVVETILAELPQYADLIRGWVPREKCEDPAQWGQQIGKYLSNIDVEDELEGPDLFAAIVDPDVMEQEMLQLDRLDEAIARIIKRLMQVKASKQFVPNMRKNARPEPKLIAASAIANAQSAVLIENEPKPTTHTEIIVSAKSDAEKCVFAAETVVVIDGTRIDEPSSVTPDADSQPVVLIENEPKPATPTEIIISAKSDAEKGAFIAQSDIVIEGTRTDGPASVSPEIPRNECFGLIHGIVDNFAKPAPTTVEELQSFSAFCQQESKGIGRVDRRQYWKG